MDVMVVGDLHGNHELAKKALSYSMPVVFLGDYLDSYTRSDEDQLITLDIVLEAAEIGTAIALLGNHELSYLDRSMRCSGWDEEKQSMVDRYYRDRMLERMLPFVKREGFLLSHAGVSSYLLSQESQTLDEYLESYRFNQIGYRRGGRKPVGGLHWCDWAEFSPIEGVRQIVGHTRGRFIREKEGNYCIDVLEDNSTAVAIINNGKVDFVDL